MIVALRRLSALIVLLAVLAVAGAVHSAAQAPGGELRVSALFQSDSPVVRSTVPQQKMAQFRCPGGQLVFLTRACGCNGACCACGPDRRYLNHCTCRCESAPTSCTRGHSAGNP